MAGCPSYRDELNEVRHEREDPTIGITARASVSRSGRIHRVFLTFSEVEFVDRPFVHSSMSTWAFIPPNPNALTAARLGEADTAINTLLMDTPKNSYLINGHNYKDQYLPIYLPGNGSLLATVAMMAAGWDGAPAIHAPGFPQDGTWTVSWEGLRRIP